MAPWCLLGHPVASLWPAGGSPPSLGQVDFARADGSAGPSLLPSSGPVVGSCMGSPGQSLSQTSRGSSRNDLPFKPG